MSTDYVRGGWFSYTNTHIQMLVPFFSQSRRKKKSSEGDLKATFLGLTEILINIEKELTQKTKTERILSASSRNALALVVTTEREQEGWCVWQLEPLNQTHETQRRKPLQGKHEFDFSIIGVSSPIWCPTAAAPGLGVVIMHSHASMESDKTINPA